MKRTIALILVVLTLVGMLAGCEKNTNNDSNVTQAQTQAPTQAETQAPTQAETQAPTQPQQNTQAAVGDILDAPEVTFDASIEDLYIYYTYPGETEEDMPSMEIAIDQVTEDTYVIYMSNGFLKLDEVIYEVTDAGVEKYCRDVFSADFTHDTEPTYTELRAEADKILELFSLFMIVGEQWENVKFKKTDDFAYSLTGDVYTYDIIENGETAGKAWIDVATGLLVKLLDTDGNALFSVQDIKTSNIEIPSYK